MTGSRALDSHRSILAVGLGHEVVAAGYRVYYTTAADLVAAMHTAFLEGTWTQKLRFYTAPACW
jgi:DNA replication protein DnaC